MIVRTVLGAYIYVMMIVFGISSIPLENTEIREHDTLILKHL